jgi:hypothetical protein
MPNVSSCFPLAFDRRNARARLPRRVSWIFGACSGGPAFGCNLNGSCVVPDVSPLATLERAGAGVTAA